MLRSHRFTVSAVQAQELDDIFDSMDFDGNGELSVGERAGGMTVFFKGNIQEKVRSVVNLKFAAGCFNRGIFFFCVSHTLVAPEVEAVFEAPQDLHARHDSA